MNDGGVQSTILTVASESQPKAQCRPRLVPGLESADRRAVCMNAKGHDWKNFCRKCLCFAHGHFPVFPSQSLIVTDV